MAQKLYEESNIQAIADAIRAKNGLTDTYKTSEMATAINSIPSGGGGDLPEEAYLITGVCSNRFYYGEWDWFIEKYGNKVTTKDLEYGESMFYMSTVTTIPFELNYKTYAQGYAISSMFDGCKNLTAIPKINNCTPNNTDEIFRECHCLKELPSDISTWFNWNCIDNSTSSSAGKQNAMFHYCYSLRSIPMDFLSHGSRNTRYSNSYFYQGFNGCWTLDELVGLPIPYTSSWASNGFASTFNDCYRLKNVTFAMSDGVPYVMNWKGQTINLATYIGYTPYIDCMFVYNSGITVDKEVTDDATYQALKDDPDWFTANVAYSRYNHDSAVATINSLPDTSAYGTNTIKFLGESGSATDGGAINTLTEEEIAVAAAKGWTVTLV